MSGQLIRSKNAETSIAIGLALLILLAGGCRQAPDTDTRFYERELAEMEREQNQAARIVKPLKDGYPWRGKTKEPTCVPCRITATDRALKAEIKFLHETVHGKTKTRLRLRD